MFNVERPKLIPPSLIEKKSWHGSDVLQSLNETFHSKCYICETKEPPNINIEHFDAHLNDVEKMYDWNNLFLSCSRCNNIKRHLYNNLINCTDARVDALRLIKHGPPASPYGKAVTIEATNDDPSTIETAALLRKIFNEDNTANKELSGEWLRRKVYMRVSLLQSHINRYANEDTLESDKIDALLRIKHLMKKNQEYSAFLRWVVLDSPKLLEIVKDSID